MRFGKFSEAVAESVRGFVGLLLRLLGRSTQEVEIELREARRIEKMLIEAEGERRQVEVAELTAWLEQARYGIAGRHEYLIEPVTNAERVGDLDSAGREAVYRARAVLARAEKACGWMTFDECAAQLGDDAILREKTEFGERLSGCVE